MVAINKEAILGAYDSIAKAMTDAGGVIIREVEAKKVIDAYVKAGNGEAALVATEAFRQAKKIDAAGGKRVDAGDITKARGVLDQALDRVNDGFVTLGPRELASVKRELRPLVAALVELGRASELPAEDRPRQETFTRALDHLANVLAANLGEDRQLDGKEAKSLVSKLRSGHRYTEAQAIENLIKIAGQQAPGDDPIPAAGLSGAIAWSKEQIAKRFERGQLENLPETWAAVHRLGRALEAEILEPVVANPKASVYDAFKLKSPDQQFFALQKISNNDEGGVSYPGEVPAHVDAEMKRHVDSVVEGLVADGFTIAERSTSAQKMINVEGLEVPAGFSTYLRATKDGHPELALEYFFDRSGRDLGTWRIDPQPEGYIAVMASGDSSDYAISSRWRPKQEFTDREAQDRFRDHPSDEAASTIQLARLYLGRSGEVPVEEFDGTKYNTWQTGTARREGKDYLIVRWNDSTDASYTFYFTKSRLGETTPYQLSIVNFDN